MTPQYVQVVNRTHHAQNTVPTKSHFFVFIATLPVSYLHFKNSDLREAFKTRDLAKIPVLCSFIKYMVLPDFFENLNYNGQ